RGDPGRRPGWIGDPSAGPLGVQAVRRHGLLHVADQPRLIEEPVLRSIEAGGEEAHALLQEADRRSREAVLGTLVAPGSDQSPHRAADVFEYAEDHVPVAVAPAPHCKHRAADSVVVLAG